MFNSEVDFREAIINGMNPDWRYDPEEDIEFFDCVEGNEEEFEDVMIYDELEERELLKLCDLTGYCEDNYTSALYKRMLDTLKSIPIWDTVVFPNCAIIKINDSFFKIDIDPETPKFHVTQIEDKSDIPDLVFTLLKNPYDGNLNKED